MANDPSYFVLKRFHVGLAILVILVGFGVQIGLSLGKFSSLEQRVTVLETSNASITAVVVEAAKLRVEIEGLRRDLEKLEKFR